MENQIRDFIINFTSILYEAMPFIVLGAVIAGILEELVPQQWIARLVPRNRMLAIAMSTLLGLIFPMCECGIVPVMRRLLRKGLPLSCCTAYLLAGPIINPVVILSTAVAFQGGETSTWRDGRGFIMVFLRVLGGFFVAFVTSLIVERLFRRHGYELLTLLSRPKHVSGEQDPGEETTAKTGVWGKLTRISETALHDFIDITLFLILGALLAALTRMFLTPGDIERLSHSYPLVTILGMIALAIVLCLCSEADAFVAASFTTLAPSAKIAFLVLGPMFDLKLYFMYTRVFRPRLIYTIFGSVFVLTVIYSLAVHGFWQYVVIPSAAPGSITPN